MADAEAMAAGVAPFPCQIFRSAEEFQHYAAGAEAQRANRWQYEQSLASPGKQIVLPGTCGVCLCEARFTSATRGGEATATGYVPNWRESMACDCAQHLTNRERSLLHYLLAYGLLQPWMRVLAFGELGNLHSPLRALAGQFTWRPAMEAPPPGRAVHLVISSEQLDGASARPDTLARVAALLVPGGHFVFTAQFDPASSALDDPRIGWSILKTLKSVGFTDAKVCTFWSEEFGYLGLFNFIFSASK